MKMKTENSGSGLSVSPGVRNRIAQLSGFCASRCFQCAACSSVCELSDGNTAFPRKHMQYAQLGLWEKIKTDSSIWICHQCNDCSVYCPQDARPGDVMAGLRVFFISENAVFKSVGKMYENIGKWWPVFIGIPVFFWYLFFLITVGAPGLGQTESPFQFETFVPHWMIYIVNIPVLTGVLIAMAVSSRRVWHHWGAPDVRWSLILNLFLKSVKEVVLHKRMKLCSAAKQRNIGHYLVMWGFVGATAIALVIATLPSLLSQTFPLSLSHPLKLAGNAAGIFMISGTIFILSRRWSDSRKMGRTAAVDYYFLLLILSVVVTGFGAQFLRIVLQQSLALSVYILHLGLALSLFFSIPFSKFSHVWYRLLAITRHNVVMHTNIYPFFQYASENDQ